jgi:hypothetical protein
MLPCEVQTTHAQGGAQVEQANRLLYYSLYSIRYTTTPVMLTYNQIG